MTQKIFQTIKSADDRKTLQDDINTMLNWADKWQLEFHPDKCVSMSINNNGEQTGTYEIKNMALKQVNQEKDIGVIVNEQLKFESHFMKRLTRQMV